MKWLVSDIYFIYCLQKYIFSSSAKIIGIYASDKIVIISLHKIFSEGQKSRDKQETFWDLHFETLICSDPLGVFK